MPEQVGIDEAAKRLAVSTATIRRRIKAGKLPAEVDSRGRYLISFEPAAEHREPPKPRKTFGEVAFADPLGLYGGRAGFKSYNPSVLVTRKGLHTYDEMLRDDQVKAALAFKTSAITASGWKIESPGEKGEDWEQRRFLQDQLDSLPGTFEDAVGGLLTALRYGFAVQELIYEMVPDGEWKGKVGLSALKTRSPHSISFDVDEYGNIAPEGIIQMHRHDVGERRLPLDKFIVFQYENEFGNPYGRSDLEAVYKPWWLKDNAYKWLGMMLERYGIPPMVALYNPEMYDNTQILAMQQIFGSLQAATSGMIPRSAPENLELWAPQLAGQVGSVFVPTLDMLNRDIARALLMPGLLGVTPDQLGSFARAKVIFDVFLLVVERLRADLSETINEQLVKRLIEMNFSGDELPKFSWTPLSEDDQGELLKTWGELLGAGAVTAQPDDEAHIRELLEFPERKEGDAPPATLLPPGMAPLPPTPDEAGVSPVVPPAAAPQQRGRAPTLPPPNTAAADDEQTKRYLEIGTGLLFRALAAVDAANDALFADRTVATVTQAAKTLIQRVVNRFGEGKAPDLETATAAEFVRRYGVERVVGIGDETRKLLRQTLAEGVLAGEDREALARRVRTYFRQATEDRARVIAATESNRASNFGIFEGMRQAGVRFKRWRTMADERVRPIHMELAGQVKELEAPFVVPSTGEVGWFPGDDHFGAHGAIGCRCHLEPARITGRRGRPRAATFADDPPDTELSAALAEHEAAMLTAVQAGLRAQKRAVLGVLMQDETPVSFG